MKKKKQKSSYKQDKLNKLVSWDNLNTLTLFGDYNKQWEQWISQRIVVTMSRVLQENCMDVLIFLGRHILVDAYRCMNEGQLPRIAHCRSLLVNGALLLFGVVTGTRQRGKWHMLVLCSCYLALSCHHPLTNQFYFPVLFCWIDVDGCLVM